ncbi:hypothetical protein V1264_015335 [Littorina saxatilis]|uniref:Fibrinogen C-terminal domain-containing protein n=2 Tax=Littorina saxatilis TaxID=31220 RepID=A0AAN9BLG8_9CAEN
MCENGGSLDGQQCRCPSQYAGDRCQRYIRDCKEAHANGYQSHAYNGVYLIQPATAPAPFKVRCDAAAGGLTMSFKRTTANFNVDWATAKEGINNDLANDLNNFFIGLDNLHHLLLQAKYCLTHVFTKYDNDWTLSASAFYSNLTIGVDSTFFSLTYSKFSTSTNDPSDNGFDAAGPLLFAAVDRDPTGCAVAHGGAPGWYGSDCGGYSLFADPVVWPVLGSPRTCMLTLIYVSRVGPLYDDE